MDVAKMSFSFDSQFSKTTGWVTDISESEGDGEQVDYCITDDGDLLFGKLHVVDGVVDDKWILSMKKKTFERLIDLYNERIKQG